MRAENWQRQQSAHGNLWQETTNSRSLLSISESLQGRPGRFLLVDLFCNPPEKAGAAFNLFRRR